MENTKIRQPIITVAGHVDHGKTSLLDAFRSTELQKDEAGGITQKISFTKMPVEQVRARCPLIEKSKIDLKIPGFLFIDTPGHAAFTHLRKRGGSLADIAIVVVDIKDGIRPQTAEVISILKANKTPFVIALNKLDTLSGWQKRPSLRESLDGQTINVREEFDTALLTFQGALQAHGFESDLFYEVQDFTKKVAIVPCSARTKEGISELLFVLCGLCQKFLTKQLTLSEDAKGVILEIKKEKSSEHVESILYDGLLKEGDEIAIATFDGIILTKVRAIEEIQALNTKYKAVPEAQAATGLRLRLADKSDIVPGMPFRVVKNNLSVIKQEFKHEVSDSINVDKQGIIVKADSLGSLEALLTLLKQSGVSVVKAGIGPITKSDVVAAKANFTINPLDAIIVGFNVSAEEDVEYGLVKVITQEVVYRLIDDLSKWRTNKQKEIEKEKLMGLATLCKLEILQQHVFRNSNPAIFGVRIVAGTLKTGIPLIDDRGDDLAHVKGIQSDKHGVGEASSGMEVAVSLGGVTFDRQLKEIKYLYSNISEMQFKAFKKHKDLLGSDELQVLQEIADKKRKANDEWGF